MFLLCHRRRQDPLADEKACVGFDTRTCMVSFGGTPCAWSFSSPSSAKEARIFTSSGSVGQPNQPFSPTALMKVLAEAGFDDVD
jgi:hypothetical protein